jgi:hypothetical protein
METPAVCRDEAKGNKSDEVVYPSDIEHQQQQKKKHDEL